MTVLLRLIAALVFSALAASLIVSLRELKWRADIRTCEGEKKLEKIGYEKLILKRFRPKPSRRTRRFESDHTAVPLDAPMREEKRRSSDGFSSLIASFVFASDPPFDELRVYGIKDGVKHFVRTYAYYPENYRDVKARAEAYNAKRGVHTVEE